MKLFLKAIRAPFLTATLVPILLGGIEAARNGFFDSTLFLLALVAGLLFHASANVLNDYFDYYGGTDNINKYYNPFSGGSRLIQDGIYTPKRTLALGLSLLAIGIVIGLYLVFREGLPLIVFGLFGIFLIFTYSVKRFGLSYFGRGLGELTVGIAFGPLMVLGTYYLLAGGLALSALWLSLPVAILIALVLLANGYPDFEADRQTNKHTIVVSFGRERTRYIYAILLLMVYVLIVAGVAFYIIPGFTLVALLTLPMAAIAVKKLFATHLDPRGVVAVCGMTVGLHLITGLLLSAGALLAMVFSNNV